MIQRIRTVRILIVELDRVLSVGVGRPLGVQIVGTDVVHAGGSAGSKCSAGTVSLSVPAGEGIAGMGGQTESAVIRNLDLLVVRHCFGGTFLISTEVAVIRDGHSGSLVAPDGVQRHIAGDLHGTVGIVRRAGAVSLGVPAQEDLAVVGEAVALDGGLGALGVLLGVGHGAGSASGIGIVGHRVLRLATDFGAQLVIFGDLGAEIEGHTIEGIFIAFQHPAQEFVVAVLCNLAHGHIGFVDGAVHGNLGEGLENSPTVYIIYRHRVGGSHPLGVQGDVLRGHSLVGEDMGGAFAQFVVIPAGERIALFACGCSGGGVGHIGDIRLILLGHGVHHITAVNKLDLVAVAVVVELSAVVYTSVPRTVSFISGKAGDVIEVLIPGNAGIAHHYRIGMMQRILSPVNGDAVLALQNLNIVAGAGGTAAFAVGYIEVAAAKRHHIDTCLVGTATAFRGRPVCTAVAAGRPLIADVSAVLGSDGPERDGSIAGAVVGVLFLGTDQIAPPIITPLPPAVGMLFLAAAEGRTVGGPEVDGVLIALVEHIDNGAAVTGNSLLLNPPNIEAIVRLCSGRCQLAGGAGHGFGFLKGELIIVHILLPVDDGVIGLVCCRPLGVHSRVRLDGGEVSLCRQTLVRVPSVEGVPGLGGSRRSLCGGAGGIKYRGHIAAAVGFEGDPIALLHLGIQRNVAVLDGHRRDLVGKSTVSVPAGDSFVGTHGKAHIFKGDLLAGRARLSGDDTAVVVLEVDIVAVGEHGIDPNGRVFAGQSGDRTEGNRRIPAGKHLAVLCLDLRLQQRVAILHDLRVHFFAIDIKFIGAVGGVVWVR